MVHDARRSLHLQRHDLARHIAANQDLVCTTAADDRHHHLVRSGQDIEHIVAFQPVDFGLFQPLEADVQASAIDALIGDDEIVRNFGPKHDNRVDARTTVDLQRCVDVVKEAVIAIAAKDLCFLAPSLAGGFGAQDESTHDEGVIATFAIKLGQALVREHIHRVVAQTAIDDHRQAVAIRQEALRGIDRFKGISDGDERHLAARSEQLADLEEIIPCTAIQREDGPGVVAVEGIRPAQRHRIRHVLHIARMSAP